MPKLKKKATSSNSNEQRLRIAVKLKIRPRKGLKALDLSGFGKPGRNLRLLPLIESLSGKRVGQLMNKARQIDPEAKLPDFSLWHQIISPAGVHPDELAAAMRRLDIVETAYVMRPVPPPAPPPINLKNYRNSSQTYLEAAPDGINALYAWDLSAAAQTEGGDGFGIGFIDIEQGWNLHHEDLKDANIQLIPGISGDNHYFCDHGTSVLGEILMVPNDRSGTLIGGLGIAPAASARVVSQWRTPNYYNKTDPKSFNTADAIVSAVSSMAFGDVLLLEAQDQDPFKVYPGDWPAEIADGTFDAILLATALGIVVVEAAGNGTNDLNGYTTTPTSGTGKKIFDRNPINNDFRDSGAIMVGAGASATIGAVSPSGLPKSAHEPYASSNYGNRIDCYAWGENIYTTDSDVTGSAASDNWYTSPPYFGATSGASAIVAGAVLIVQGLARGFLKYRLSPRALRQILQKYGTPSTTRQTTPPTQLNTATDIIGVMPNLKDILSSNEFRMAPDLYLRDYVGDNGDPTTGILSQSPDIIVRQAAVGNPQLAYGAGSNTENDPALSEDVAAGQTNYVYVRVSNRGGSPTTVVSVDVYWSPPATLVQPQLWKNNKIGTAVLPSVATGSVLTVSGGVAWANPPGPGHYCFVAVAGSPEDPNPGIPVFQPIPGYSAFDQYLDFIDNNNNVAWRNFNVVTGPPGPAAPPPWPQPPPPSPRRHSPRPPSPPHWPDPPPDFYSMPFLIPGAFDTGHVFELEAIGGLPRGSRAFLETPDWLADALRFLPCEIKRNAKIRTASIPLNPSGLQRLGTVTLQAGSVAQCRLLVQLPEESRQYGYEFGVRQLYKKREVGRITWRFAALSKENVRRGTPQG